MILHACDLDKDNLSDSRHNKHTKKGRAGEGTGNAVLEAGKRWMAEQDFADPTEWNLS